MRHPRLSRLVAVGLLLALSACAGADRAEIPKRETVIATSYRAVDHLLALWGRPLDPDKPILVATLADNDDLGKSSSFGRLVPEQMASRLVNSGYTVSEIKLRNGMLVKRQGGQFMLSRDALKIGNATGAQAVLAGTYTVGKSNVFVNLKLIRAADGRIMAAHDYMMPLDRDIHHLLDEGMVTVY